MDTNAPNTPNIPTPPASPPPPDDAPWLKNTANKPPPTPIIVTPPVIAEVRKTATPAPATMVKPWADNPKPAPPPPLPRPVTAPVSEKPKFKPMEPSKTMNWIRGLAVVFVGLIIFGALLLLLWPRLTGKSINNTNSESVFENSAVIPAIPPTTTISTIDGAAVTYTTPTTSPETAAPATISVPSTDETKLNKKLGETAEFFIRDPIIFTDPKNPNRSYEIEAQEFTDSRCPKEAVCVWAGERGLRLKITDKQTGNSNEIYLGTSRAQTVKIMGLTITLFEIEDGKGGVYAKIKVE